ncbi:MAG: succinic semialdehyde dehydrogenase [Propioniciclava sp.]|uniref:succinic semialdehyde dehydrogenase n=1 Tax=Propioniciclava sp. TaxID=2038686 RepID=UPI0039E3A711
MTATAPAYDQHTDDRSERRVPAPSEIGRLLALLTASSGEASETVSPLDGRPVARVPQSNSADVDAAVATARRAQPAWAALGPRERGRRLTRFHDLLLDHQDRLADLIITETGKARRDAYDEVVHLALTARYCATMAERVLRDERRPGLVRGLIRIDVHHHPKGVVGLITPWNYPLTMAMADGVAALAAGNTVVAKPDAQTMLTALAGVELLREAGVPEDAWRVVAGPGDMIGGALIDRVDHICFTGSTRTGRLVAARAGERLIGSSLELGGKNAMVVCADADLDAAVAGALRGCFANAGQLCVSFERLYVAREIYDVFSDRFVEAVGRLELAPGYGWSSQVGTLVSPAQLEKVTRHLEDARTQGARVLVGGRHRPDLAPWSVEPTVLEGVRPGMECWRDETFGPVVALYPFDDEDAAIEAVNDSAHGLNASVWSRDTRRARELAARIVSGTVNINECYAATMASISAPMGGRRDSGLGRRQGPEGILRFTDTQAVATQHVMRLSAPDGMAEDAFARLVAGGLRLMRRAGL